MTNFLQVIFDAVAYGLLGIVVFIALAAYRAMTSGWDDSNITNWFRLFIHMVLHPEDFRHMYYVVRHVDNTPQRARRVFWYLNKDETTEVVKTRPTNAEIWK
jgi:hypothetical protein